MTQKKSDKITKNLIVTIVGIISFYILIIVFCYTSSGEDFTLFIGQTEELDNTTRLYRFNSSDCMYLEELQDIWCINNKAAENETVPI